jgi:uncharacterized surface protein with fasciclin (FAS1) repeats
MLTSAAGKRLSARERGLAERAYAVFCEKHSADVSLQEFVKTHWQADRAPSLYPRIGCHGRSHHHHRQKNVLETLKCDGRFAVLLGLIAQAGLEREMSCGDAITLFAPTDAAFGKLNPEVSKAIAGNPVLLEKTIKYHIVNGKVKSADLHTGEVRTAAEGAEVQIVIVEGGCRRVQLQDASDNRDVIDVTEADLESEHGVVHVIDEVMMSPDVWEEVRTLAQPMMLSAAAGAIGLFRTRRTLWDIISERRDLSTLQKLADIADLDDTLRSTGPFTVFAPTNDAFDKLGQDVFSDLMGNKAKLRDVLLYHIMPGKIPTSLLVSANIYQTMLPADTLTILVNDWYMPGMYRTINGHSRILVGDLDARNGYVHVVSEVLMPGEAKLPRTRARVERAGKPMPALVPRARKPMPALVPCARKPMPALVPCVGKPLPALVPIAGTKPLPALVPIAGTKPLPALKPIAGTKPLPALVSIGTSDGKREEGAAPPARRRRAMPALERVPTAMPALERIPTAMPALERIPVAATPTVQKAEPATAVVRVPTVGKGLVASAHVAALLAEMDRVPASTVSAAAAETPHESMGGLTKRVLAHVAREVEQDLMAPGKTFGALTSAGDLRNLVAEMTVAAQDLASDAPAATPIYTHLSQAKLYGASTSAAGKGRLAVNAHVLREALAAHGDDAVAQVLCGIALPERPIALISNPWQAWSRLVGNALKRVVIGVSSADAIYNAATVEFRNSVNMVFSFNRRRTDADIAERISLFAHMAGGIMDASWIIVAGEKPDWTTYVRKEVLSGAVSDEALVGNRAILTTRTLEGKVAAALKHLATTSADLRGDAKYESAWREAKGIASRALDKYKEGKRADERPYAHFISLCCGGYLLHICRAESLGREGGRDVQRGHIDRVVRRVLSGQTKDDSD